MFRQFIAWYRAEDPEEIVLRTPIDLVVALSYASLPDRLTKGTTEALLRARSYAMRLPRAKLAFTNCSHSRFPRCAAREYELKRRLLGGFPHICAKAADNSVVEAEAIRDAAPFPPKNILLVGGESHLPSAKLIWQSVFPEAQIWLRCMPFEFEHEPGFPFFVGRYPATTLFGSLARHVLFLLFGLRIRKLTHKAG